MGYNTGRKLHPNERRPPMSHSPRNPADLLHLGTDSALCRLLRACEVEEAYITGGASDYDKLLALAAALPLCEGHSLRNEVNATLTQATGIPAPLCPHTAHAHWNAWVEIHFYGRQATTVDLPETCPLCGSASPLVIPAEDCAPLSDPLTVHASDLTAWSAALINALPTDSTPARYTLPEGYAFTRPNPYHANLAVGKAADGEALSPKERDLLVTQALRVWGLSLVGKETAPFLLQGGAPEAVTALLAYLATSKALPKMIWFPDDPSHTESVSGLYPQVRTGYTVTEGESTEATENKKKVYAKTAPIGRATILAQ